MDSAPDKRVPSTIPAHDMIDAVRAGTMWEFFRDRALEAPTPQIAENSAVDGGVVVARMLSGKGNKGCDAGRKEFANLIKAGIIEPTKVVRIALENVVSVAILSIAFGHS